MKKCVKCGFEGEGNYCPQCGARMEIIVKVAERNSVKHATRKKSTDKKKIIIIILLIMVVALAGLVLIKLGTVNGSSIDNTNWSDGENVTLTENQCRELPSGTYIIGEDLPAGKYMLEYTTTMSKDEYWSNDYLYITFAESDGKDKTFAEIQFDDQFGPVEYEDAVEGKSFYANFNDGDTIRVNSEFGDWTY